MTGQPKILLSERERMDNAIKFRLAFAFSVVVHGTWFSRKRVYVLLQKIIMAQS